MILFTTFCLILYFASESLFVYDKLSYHPFEGTTVDASEKLRMTKSLGPTNKLMMLSNHGPLALGTSVKEAFRLLYLFCRACTYQVKLLSITKDPSEINLIQETEKIEMLSRAKKSQQAAYNEDELMFHRMERKLLRQYGKDNIFI